MNIESIDLLYESALILAAVSFSLAAYVLARGVSNKLHILYSFLTFTISIWAMSFFIAGILTWRPFETVHLTATLLLPSLALFFLDRLIRPAGLFFLWLKRLAIAFPVILVPFVLFGFDRYSFIRDPALYSPALIFLACIYLFVSEAAGGAAVRSSAARGGLDEDENDGRAILGSLRARNLWLYFGGAFVTFISVMDRVEWIGRTLPAIGNFIVVFYLYFLKDVVLQQHYTSFRRLMNQIFSNGITAFILSLVIVYITALVDDPVLFFLNSFLAAFVMVFSVDPIRKLANMLFVTLFYRESSEIQSLVDRHSSSITEAANVGSLVEITDSFIHDALEKNIMSLYVLDAELMKYRKQYDSTVLHKLPLQLPVTFPLVEHWKRAKNWKPISTKELEDQLENVTVQSDIAAIDLNIEGLRGLNSNLAFPFKIQDSILGFVTIKYDELEDFWSTKLSNLPLYEPFFQRAARALHELDIFEKLRERDRLVAMGEMSAGLAHEIRNPLGAIKGAAQMLQDDASNQQFLDIIIEEVNRLNSVVSEFLNYAKPFSGDKHEQDLNELLEKAIRQFERDADGFSVPVQFEFQANPSLPRLLCHAELIYQVVVNLLQNAVHAIEKGHRNGNSSAEGRVQVSVLAQRHRNEYEVSVAVEDNGPGMSTEEIDKIFIPFYTASGKGTGMGLPICQRIAESHGGRIDVDSTVGVGTTMTLRFRSGQTRD